jgi:hypothetical protein
MSTGSPKDKSNRRLTRVRAITGTMDSYQWWARICRYFFPETAKRWPEGSDAESKPLTVTEQIYGHLRLERLDRFGSYQQPRRHRANIEPLDQLLGPAREEVDDAELRKPDELSED